MNPRQQDFYGELNELELGERVSDCLFTELAGSIYSTVENRTWALILQCYRFMYEATNGNVPADWKPAIDDKGMWHPAAAS